MFYLKKEDVSLRLFMESDIENKVNWINDSRNNTYLHYDIPLNSKKTLEWFLNKSQNRLDCIIEYQKIPVGLIGLLQIDNVNLKAEFYICIGRDDFKRKGISTGATKLIIDYAFKELGLKKIYLNVDEENKIACHLYEKLGFVREGLFVKDMFHNNKWINRCRYAIFAERF